jgi:uncharacterized Zn-binding protein involved in type VI secretion
MPGAVRQKIDNAGGALLQGSPNVFVNGFPLVRKGDRVSPHGKGKHSNPVMEQGSSTVFCNGKKVCRKGDLATCGHKASGSSNVFVGG